MSAGASEPVCPRTTSQHKLKKFSLTLTRYRVPLLAKSKKVVRSVSRNSRGQLSALNGIHDDEMFKPVKPSQTRQCTDVVSESNDSVLSTEFELVKPVNPNRTSKITDDTNEISESDVSDNAEAVKPVNPSKTRKFAHFFNESNDLHVTSKVKLNSSHENEVVKPVKATNRRRKRAHVLSESSDEDGLTRKTVHRSVRKLSPTQQPLASAASPEGTTQETTPIPGHKPARSTTTQQSHKKKLLHKQTARFATAMDKMPNARKRKNHSRLPVPLTRKTMNRSVLKDKALNHNNGSSIVKQEKSERCSTYRYCRA